MKQVKCEKSHTEVRECGCIQRSYSCNCTHKTIHMTGKDTKLNNLFQRLLRDILERKNEFNLKIKSIDTFTQFKLKKTPKNCRHYLTVSHQTFTCPINQVIICTTLISEKRSLVTMKLTIYFLKNDLK